MRVAGLLVLVVFVLAKSSAIPYSWTHALKADSCYWAPRGSLRFLGPSEPDADAREMQRACFYRRGLASDSPMVKRIERKFPDAAQLAAWRR